jgi:hypothetical protein
MASFLKLSTTEPLCSERPTFFNAYKWPDGSITLKTFESSPFPIFATII